MVHAKLHKAMIGLALISAALATSLATSVHPPRARSAPAPLRGPHATPGFRRHASQGELRIPTLLLGTSQVPTLDLASLSSRSDSPVCAPGNNHLDPGQALWELSDWEVRARGCGEMESIAQCGYSDWVDGTNVAAFAAGWDGDSYSHYRKILGDGNCFWRSVVIGTITSGDAGKQRLYNAILTLPVEYDAVVTHRMMEWFQAGASLDALTHEIDNDLVLAARALAVVELRRDPTGYTHGLPFDLVTGTTLGNYCKGMLQMNNWTENEIEKNALASALGIVIVTRTRNTYTVQPDGHSDASFLPRQLGKRDDDDGRHGRPQRGSTYDPYRQRSNDLFEAPEFVPRVHIVFSENQMICNRAYAKEHSRRSLVSNNSHYDLLKCDAPTEATSLAVDGAAYANWVKDGGPWLSEAPVSEGADAGTEIPAHLIDAAQNMGLSTEQVETFKACWPMVQESMPHAGIDAVFDAALGMAMGA